MMFRWAAVTLSGKNLRIYAENRVRAIQLVKRETGEDWVAIEPAGHWYSGMGSKAVRNGATRLDIVDWDKAGPVEGWPGGPSGGPSDSKAKKPKNLRELQAKEQGKPGADAPIGPARVPALNGRAVAQVAREAAQTLPQVPRKCVAMKLPSREPCGEDAPCDVTWTDGSKSPMCKDCALKTQQLAQSHGSRLSVTGMEVA